MTDTYIRTAAMLLVIALLLAGQGLYAKDIDFRGMFRSYTGVRLSEMDIPVQEQTVDLSIKGWGDKTALTVNPYVYFGPGADPEIGIREAYVDIYLDEVDIRVGKQAIVWGKAEGAFITDIVSPQDMRSFILADFTEIRKGIPAVKADWYKGAFTFEGVWVPRFVPSDPPAPDSIWAREMDFSSAPFTVDSNTTFSAPVRPDDSLENSEFFGKVSYFSSLVNAEVMFGYTWNDLPVISGAVITSQHAVEISREHYRHWVVGGSLSTTVSSVVLRSEAALYLDKAFTVINPTSGPEIEPHHEAHALVGADWSLGEVNLSSQYILQYVTDYHERMINTSELQHTVTFRAQRSLLSDDLDLSLFVYAGLDPADALLRPSFTYAIEDAVNLTGGVELFLGDESGRFGSYRDNTMGYVSLQWYF